MRIKCVEDVVANLEDGKKEVAFKKGKIYRAYQWMRPVDYDFVRTWCAKNELKEKIRHIIHCEDGSLDDFFKKHFEVVFYE